MNNMKMDVKSIPSGIDLRLNLLAADSLFADNIEISPFTLKEIREFGYTNYMKNLRILTLDKDVFTEDDKSLNKYSIIELILMSKNQFLIDTFSDALCLFLKEKKEDLVVNSSIGFIFNGRSLDSGMAKIVNTSSFNDILQIIKYQNCLVNTFEEYKKLNPADELARSILEKFKKADEKIANQKANERDNSNGQEIDFSDIVSSVSTKSMNYNKETVWDLTIYQMYDEYKRLEAISGYELNMMAMIQGAKIENLKHWSSRIES